MRVHRCGVVALALQISAGALGQAAVSVYDAEFTDYDADLSLMPQIAVHESYAVVFGSHELLLYDKALPITPAGWQDRRFWTSFGYGTHEFIPLYNDPFMIYGSWLTYPRADYDPMTNTVWMMASESRPLVGPPTPRPEIENRWCEDRFVLHMATTPINASVITLLDCDSLFATPPNCWHYLTGANAVDVSDLSINRYFDTSAGPHLPFTDPPTHLSMAFDEQAVMVAAMSPADCSVGLGAGRRGQGVLILERDLNGGLSSYHEDGSPMPSEMTMVRFDDLPFPDSTAHALAVQEPYDFEKANPEFENITLFITTDGAQYTAGSVGTIRGVRLRGLYWDSDQNRWTMRQALEIDDPTPPVTFRLKDAAFDPSLELGAVFGASPPFLPQAPSGFRPLNDNEMFTSAVLAEDWLGNNRVFAVHAGVATFGTGQSADDRWVVQWYVIDPDLGNFHNPPSPDVWTPTIVAAGRIVDDGSAEPEAGDCYLPTIGVSRCGQAFVEYTFSNATTQPQIRRATLNYTYGDVVSTALVQAGPANGYFSEPQRWALYPDMQADPSTNRFWSTHSLAGGSTSIRDAWVFKTSYNCFQVDMNRDGIVDPLDMALYTDLYGQGDERADTNADDTVDVVDMLNFVHDYDGATSP
jgi:hypothetical protein